MKVKVVKVREDAVIPEYASELASGFDLVAVEDIIIAPGRTATISTGIAFEIPPGYELQIRPRSGVSLRTNLRIANTPGTVDADYRGEVKVIVDNRANLSDYPCDTGYRIDGSLVDLPVLTLDGNFTYVGESDDPVDYAGSLVIMRGDRIAQGVICPVVRVEFEEVDELHPTERGGGGFGHTGYC